MNKSILQDWVVELKPFDQAPLIACVRGIDTVVNSGDEATDNKLKAVSKMLRYIIGKVFSDKTAYTDDQVMKEETTIEIIKEVGFIESLHWYEHVRKAAKVISKTHPNPYVRRYWGVVYRGSVNKTPESLRKMYKELKDLRYKYINLKNYLDGKKNKSDVQVMQLNGMQVYLECLEENIRLKEQTNMKD